MHTVRRAAEKVTSVYLALMLTVYLLFCGFRGYQGIFAAKYTMFLILCGGYAAVMFLLTVWDWGKAPGKLLRRSSWTQRLLAVYLLLTWVSVLLSPHRAEAVRGVSRSEGALTITIYVLCFLFVSAYGRPRRWMLHLLGASVLAMSALCISQLFLKNPFGLYPGDLTYADAYIAYAGAFLGTIGNIDLLAAFYCLAIPILWVSILRLKGRDRWWLLLPLSVSLFVLVKMSVAAGLVGVFGGALLSLPVILPGARKRRGAALVLAIGAAAALIALYAVDPGGGTLHEVHELLHGRVEDSFGSGRMQIWREVLERVPERLWFGHGPDTMLLADLEGFQRYDAVRGKLIRARIDTAHNEYLNILFHQGLPALLAYLGALIDAARRWIGRRDAAAAILGTAALCCGIQALFGFSVCVTAPYFWLTLALLESGHQYVA